MDNKETNNRTNWSKEDEANFGCLYVVFVILALACVFGFIVVKNIGH